MNQPLDTLMTQLGISNADLVNASTEQLSFKMVSKGRKGRRLTPNIQDKILTALLKLKPQLKLRRRDLFMYEIGETVVEQIQHALALARDREVSYPEFVDLLAGAGITRYRVQVANCRIIFYGVLGEAHIEQGATITQALPGSFNHQAIQAAISDTQKGNIDYPTFLKKIYEAGVTEYEANLRQRTIKYMGLEHSYKEDIPAVGAQAPAAPSKPKPKAVEKNTEKKQAKKKRKPQRSSMTTKARMSFNKRRFAKRRK